MNMNKKHTLSAEEAARITRLSRPVLQHFIFNDYLPYTLDGNLQIRIERIHVMRLKLALDRLPLEIAGDYSYKDEEAIKRAKEALSLAGKLLRCHDGRRGKGSPGARPKYGVQPDSVWENPEHTDRPSDPGDEGGAAPVPK